MRVRLGVAALLVLMAAGSLPAQPLFTSAFTVEEFAERRARVLESIGDAVVVMQGATEYAGYVKFRQNNQFFYLTGVEVPRAILLMDGRTKQSTLFVQPRNERLEASEGPVLVPGGDAVRLTGIERVEARGRFARALTRAAENGRTIYTPMRTEALHAATPSHSENHTAASLDDQWDGRLSREAAFVERVRAEVPDAEIRDLDPIVDSLRLIKSPRELHQIRESTRIASEAILEGMRSANVGMYEYELEAIGDYYFKKDNSRGPAYFSLVAAGENADHPHYHASQSRLEDGQLVLWDYAPDYNYYTSDVTRMFPANGTFSPAQAEMYTIYLRLYQALMTSNRPHVTPAVILADALEKMEDILASFEFTDSRIRDAADDFVDGYRVARAGRGLGHWVGMEVHDVRAPYEVMQPGMVFTIEPAFRIREDRIYIRLEDTIAITETGYENMSDFLPVEIEDIERLMAEDGWAEKLWKQRQAAPTQSTQRNQP